MIQSTFPAREDDASEDGDNGASDSTLLQQLRERVEAGRKLVIYERDTGLFAYWFISLRCEEECHRALRYSRPLSVAVIEPAPEAESWVEVTDRITKALQKHLRKVDLGGYLGNGRFVMVLPETDLAGALIFVERMRGFVPEIQAGASGCPEDGETFSELYETAAARLPEDKRPPSQSSLAATTTS